MSEAQLSRILPKLHWRLMPTLLMMYVLAFLDRSNVSFAKMGLAADAGIGREALAGEADIGPVEKGQDIHHQQGRHQPPVQL